MLVGLLGSGRGQKETLGDTFFLRGQKGTLFLEKRFLAGKSMRFL
jgi:hypothetical protein